MERLATTPFGAGGASARVLARQARLVKRQSDLRENGATGNSSAQADKWQLLRALTEARLQFGLGDRAICLLEALASFHPDRVLDGSRPVIVFPSNRELGVRARGMAPATIRRHLAALVEAGMILRRDSANGKRFCRKDEYGQLEDAYGFDLAPLALRADEIYMAAEEARARMKAERSLRGEVTIANRDISKIIALAIEESRAGQWLEFSLEQKGINARWRGTLSLSELRERLAQLSALRKEVENAYLSSLSEEEMSCNDHHNERHYHNSNTDQIFEINGKEHEKAAAGTPNDAPRKLAISLKKLKTICPQLGDYTKAGISSWSDVVAAAEVVRTMLGISPDAWAKAKRALGEQAAAVVIAAMLEKTDTIRSAGGYLRTLTEKAEKGQFSIYPMLQALERSKPGAQT
ncbi:plasmid replication protein RepC [Allorhizobium undicola]|uniref:plasmid replication protein RepC n=1 Tax=Allorhizobium undicola TaxID=78527 RepID=UPI00048A34D0|nr:plasmid replication protein RepC [Allorhizobium undicola]